MNALSSAHLAAAADLIGQRSSAIVLSAMSPAQPDHLLSALIEVARRRQAELTLIIADLGGAWRFLDATAMVDLEAGRLRLLSIAGAVPRRLAGQVDYLPNSLWDVDRLIRTRGLAPDIFVAQVAHGGGAAYYSYGQMIGYSASALTMAPKVGFELATDVIEYDGGGGIPLDRADVVVPASAPVLADSSPPRALTPEQRQIGQRIAALIPSGATLQLGLGVLPLAVIPELVGKSDLGLHSGILPMQLQDLIGRGVITGRRKSADAGRHVATGVMGGTVESWGSDVLLQPVSRTHDPRYLFGLERLWAVNSAYEVDLAGQVNAEFVGGVRVASGGGQGDFARAAHASPGGASVLAMPSRSGRGESRIVPVLPGGHVVTTSGNDIDYVVTEFGVAVLRGRSAAERAANLLAVAHPDDRPALALGNR
jgi:4-hydroxybutyrate CoA-transferase